MPTLPTGGKVGPSPSSRVNKPSFVKKRHHGKASEWKVDHPLTSERLDDADPRSRVKEFQKNGHRSKRRFGAVTDNDD